MHKITSESAIIAAPFQIGKNFIMKSSTITFHDENPAISIGFGVKLDKCHVSLKKGGILKIGDVCEIQGRIIIEEGCTVIIGSGLVCNDSVFIHANEKRKIAIGDDCLFANPGIYNSDMHAIYDIDSDARINKPKDVEIGNRVWLARDSLILKGAIIGDGSIVGAGSVVSGTHPGQSVIAGNPAATLKEGAHWSRTITEEPSKLIPLDFPVSKFRSMAMQFNHDAVIEMGISLWDKRHLINKSDYFIIYYLCRSLIDVYFRSRKTREVELENQVITIHEIMQLLLKCFEISDKRNGPSGCYAYLAAQLINDKDKATSIYEMVKPFYEYIDKDEYKAK